MLGTYKNWVSFLVFFKINCQLESIIREIKLLNSKQFRKPSKVTQKVKYLYSGCSLKTTLEQVGNSCRVFDYISKPPITEQFIWILVVGV